MLQRIIRVVRDLTGITNDIYKYWSVSVWWYKGAKPDCIMLFLRYSRAKTEKDTSSVGIIVSKFWIPGVWFWGPQVLEEPMLLVIQWLGVHCFMFGSNFKKTIHFDAFCANSAPSIVSMGWDMLKPPTPSALQGHLRKALKWVAKETGDEAPYRTGERSALCR